MVARVFISVSVWSFTTEQSRFMCQLFIQTMSLWLEAMGMHRNPAVFCSPARRAFISLGWACFHS